MKINISDGFRKLTKFSFIFIIAAMIFFLLYGIFVDLLWLVMILAVLNLLIIIFILCFISRNYYNYNIVTENLITSYSLFGKELCKLDRNEKIYYVIFSAQDIKKENKLLVFFGNFIALSNEEFKYEKVRGMNNFIEIWDTKKVIVLPLNEKTKPYLKLDSWTEILYDIT